MICKVCGRPIANESANFCEYCGASCNDARPEEVIRPNTENQAQNSYQGYQSYSQPNAGTYYNQPMEADKENKPVSFLTWLGIMVLPMIPVVGLPGFLVLLFIWAFGKQTDKTRKNWARATLVVALIVLVILIVWVGSVMTMLSNSGMDFESFMNNYYGDFY